MSLVDALSQFHFLRPLWLLSIVPATALLWWLLKRKTRATNWQGAISESLLPFLSDGQQSRQSRTPLTGLWVTWLLAALALSGPTWSKLPQPVYQRQDALVVVLDLSLSMLTEDIKPSRLVRARHKILDVIDQRREGLTALIAYSGDAHVVTPLTDDTPTIANLVPALSPLMMPIIGSNPAAAVELAGELLVNAGIPDGRLLLITDGITGNDVEDISRWVTQRGLELSIMGVGTTEGAPIPADEGYLKDNSGKIIIPKLQRLPLEQLAEKCGGRYTDITLDSGDLHFLLPSKRPTGEEMAQLSERQFDHWRDRGALLALLIAPFAALAFRRGWLLSLTLPLLMTPERGLALDWQDLWQRPDQQAAQQLRSGESEQAAQTFRDPSWRGTAHYRAGNFEEAARSFSTIDTPEADYNRGNALARAGKLQEALAAYDQALEKNPDLEDARFNRKLVQRLLEQQQQNKQEQQNQDRDQQQNSGKQQNSKQQSDNQQGDSQQQNGDGSEEQGHKQQDHGQQGQDSQQQSGDQSQADSDSSSSEPQQQSSSDKAKSSQGNTSDSDEERKQQQSEQAAQEASQKATAQEDAQQATTEQPVDPETAQQQQVMEQWLRRIPDDPSGLLRRKFHYESNRQQHQDQARREQPQW